VVPKQCRLVLLLKLDRLEWRSWRGAEGEWYGHHNGAMREGCKTIILYAKKNYFLSSTGFKLLIKVKGNSRNDCALNS
jgi:hypothetical protein